MFSRIYTLFILLMIFISSTLFAETKYAQRDYTTNTNGYLEFATGATRTITVDLSNTHEGASFSYYGDSIDLADTNTVYLGIVVPDSVQQLCVKSATLWLLDAPWIFELWEGAYFVSDTTRIPVYNRSRNFTDSTYTKFYGMLDSISYSGATRIDRKVMGGGTGLAATATSDMAALDFRWVLKPGERYLCSLKNMTGGTSSYSVEIFFSEFREE